MRKCKLHTIPLKLTTDEYWIWLSKQKEKTTELVDKFESTCWTHKPCKECDCRGITYKKDSEHMTTCGACSGDGYMCIRCNTPAVLCPCIEEDSDSDTN